jgi:hypothetical protein
VFGARVRAGVVPAWSGVDHTGPGVIAGTIDGVHLDHRAATQRQRRDQN